VRIASRIGGSLLRRLRGDAHETARLAPVRTRTDFWLGKPAWPDPSWGAAMKPPGRANAKRAVLYMINYTSDQHYNV
jgi:hypothetical protein